MKLVPLYQKPENNIREIVDISLRNEEDPYYGYWLRLENKQLYDMLETNYYNLVHESKYRDPYKLPKIGDKVITAYNNESEDQLFDYTKLIILLKDSKEASKLRYKDGFYKNE